MTILGFTHRWPIAETMAFEREYHPNLQLSVEEKTALLGRDGDQAMAVWMVDRLTRALIGESYGVFCGKAGFEKGEQGEEDLRPFRADRFTLYCNSTTILTPYQSKGFGKILKAYFLGMASEHYSLIVGHARHGRSYRLNAEFGATFGTTYRNWYQTKQAYTFYQLDLKRTQ